MLGFVVSGAEKSEFTTGVSGKSGGAQEQSATIANIESIIFFIYFTLVSGKLQAHPTIKKLTKE
jgi:hypothetical protein